MSRPSRFNRRPQRADARFATAQRVGAVLLAVAATLLPIHSASAASTAQILGTGSSWSANAINQWIADVHAQGLQVVYTPVGSAQGRTDYAAYQNDFAGSDIGYQGTDSQSGAQDVSNRPYAYLPVAAGGTAFPYQIVVGGKRITNLRLSGPTLAGIFTGQITNWNDPTITKDNNGVKLPSKTIIPVVHSEGAGSTAQFTRYLATEFPALWNSFNGSPGMTEYYPVKGHMVAASGSDGVMNYVTSKAGDGTISYDEYSYALGAGYPVAKIENKAGVFTLPTQFNDAVALTQAQINMNPASPDYLLQNLDKVYTYSDPRTYPLSSYSYAIIPTDPNDSRMTVSKRQTLVDFLSYSICTGQSELGPIGYSSLPLNLVQAGFTQIAKLQTSDKKVTLSAKPIATCHNPTFDPAKPTSNKLALIAPMPPACDHAGRGPCGDDTSTGAANNSPTATTGKTASTSNSGKVAEAGSLTNTAGAATGGGAGAGAAKATKAAAIDPETGQPVSDSSGDGSGADSTVAPTGAELAAYKSPSSNTPYAYLAGVMLLLVLVVPPLVMRRLRRPNGDTR
ncbi:phosphate ABC transporter phosphate-binding protein [Jatrophihabitans sp. GAS493]|uniref:substrate-binding domain-containing protein n=1 Tax=Jatrophihabitans sp. GAS493 TaxID=1907575 RepID=UPI000BB81A9B|nr:substrate-binding domain-containing protein [Jatrophihabitans sp. GAS493]SOD72290.1 phosphate ABC transporter phosphate-binding protein [Jatrophihabitans sp. GAS493]